MRQVGVGADYLERAQATLQPRLTLDNSLPPISSKSFATGGARMRRPISPHRRSFGRKLGFIVFAGLSGAFAFSVLTDGGKHMGGVAPFLPETDEVLYWTGLRIDQVAVSGQRVTPDVDIFDALDLSNVRSLLSFDSRAGRERIEGLPWIATATISRIFPGSLEVHVTERKPAALWLRDKREYLIDATGRVLSAERPGTHRGLPRVAGEGAASEAKALFDLVARYPTIAQRFVMAERVGDRRWTLRLTNGVTVHLGADQEAVAFEALSSVADLGKLLSARNVIVDLRSRRRITVRPDTHGLSTTTPTQSS